MDSLYVKGLVFLTTSLPGDRSDPISKFVDIIIELIAPLKNQIQGIALIVIMASAAVWMCPFFEKEWKRKANKWILGLIGGAIILYIEDFPLEEADKKIKILVVTTKDNDEGAALMVSEKVMDKLEKQFSSKFLILPSSVHEFIAVPYKSKDDIRSCKKMVQEVNNTVLSPNEYLSDNVFVWENGELHKA